MSRLNIVVKILILTGLIAMRYFETLATLPYERILTILDFLIFIFALNVVLSIFLHVYKRRKGLLGRGNNNVTLGIRNIYYLIVSLSTIGLILSLIGVEFGTLFTSLSIIAAAIAIISKEYISPIIAGFHIALSNTISINDYVKIGELKGKVVDIRLTKLKLLSDEDELIAISNEKAYFSDIINYTKGNIRKIHINFDLSSASFKAIEDLENELTEEIKDFSEHIVPESYYLKVMEVDKDQISFRFQYELKKSDDRNMEREIRRKTIRKVINSIKLNGASSPVPAA
ncbi:mechanosensitive ion channel family protein [Portibacter marinus]|uniref:mechanosensitive ion channel family protein n=1 Tax=Portibacter marinus TaxID=2898660 RepID=UPI001F399242|nr:mechanosensitive ion channel domain-containing protein [Portibacter marinus]